MLTEKLFEAFDETDHVYTWDYKKSESAIALLDLNTDNFGMISQRIEIDEETGAMQDYRSDHYHNLRLYSKTEPKSVEEPDMQKRGYELEAFLNEVKGRFGQDIKIVESILLTNGRVYISEGNLMLDRK